MRLRIARLGGVAGSAGSHFLAVGGPQHAAAIAYRVLFSLAPLAIVLVSVFGLVLQNDDIRESVVDRVVDALPVDPSGREDIETAIEAIATPASAAGLVSLLVFLWAASGMMAALRRGLEAAMGVTERRPVARAKLVDLALICGIALLVLLSVLLGLVADLVGRLLAELSAAVGIGSGVGEEAVKVGVPVLLWIATSLCLYRFVPAARLRTRAALAGAVSSAAMFLAISLGSGLVYATTEWSLVYGSLTSIFVFLYSVYLCAGALLLGAAVAAHWSRPPGAPAGAFGAGLREGIRGLFVRRTPG